MLVGDFLYSRAFQMMLDAGDMRVMEILADATNVIAEGEVLQLMNMHDASLDEAAYLRVIRSKTAKLFEASARLGAVLAGADPEVEEACASYGQALGTAFQVIDDVLDYAGEAGEMGKNLGDDLREGKATIAADRCHATRHARAARHSFAAPSKPAAVSELAHIVAIVQAKPARWKITRDAAAAEAQRAIDALARLPHNAAQPGFATIGGSIA